MRLALLALAALATVATAAAAKEGKGHLYPRNLKRVYDGTWHGPHPFGTVPVPGGNGTEDGSGAVVTVDESMAFVKESGFALLSAENHESTLGEGIDVVFGELSLRDGIYRSPREVSLHLMGIYEWATGKIVVVGDIMFEDTRSALQGLYAACTKGRTGTAMSALAKGNVTEDRFVAALTPVFSKHHKQLHVQRPTANRRHAVAVQCPFSASYAITAGNYLDKAPAPLEISSASSFGSSTGTAGAALPGGITGAGGSSMLAGARVSPHDPSAFRNAALLGKRTGATPASDESGSGQEELVEVRGTFTSVACDTHLTIELRTLDTETLFGKAINYTLLVTVVAFTQVIVLIRQMEMTSTQAGASRVSLMTVGLQAVADSYLCLGHLTMGIAVQTLFNAFATAAFFKFICFSIFLMRWMLLIWKARRPSGFSEGWEAMRRELSMLYSRFYGSLLLGIFLLYQMQNHLRFFLFALYSFWVPQIVLNVAEDHRRPLLPMYIIGTSITRLAIPLYFWGCPRNFLHIKPQPATAAALVLWMFAQAGTLLSQYKFGPRWFIPKALLPEKYDYYRPISLEDDDDDIEAQRFAEGEETGTLVPVPADQMRECCICMESVAIFSRERMVTPCNHFFHATCLERWLEVRLECALCRSTVPPP